jgi:hypothetical protein
MSFCLTGLDIEAKAELVERTFWGNQKGGRESFAQATTRLVRSDKADPASNEEAVATLSFTVKDPDERKVGRAFANVGVEMALSTYPGMFGTGSPSAAQAYGVYWPALIPNELCPSVVHMSGRSTTVEATAATYAPVDIGEQTATMPARSTPTRSAQSTNEAPSYKTTRAPLGRLIGARSGDKGGNANIGVWVKTDEQYSWMASFLTPEKIQELLPDTRALTVKRSELPNLLALNFVIVGLLEEGVAASTRMDAQAKGLGEYLRAKIVELPTF